MNRLPSYAFFAVLVLITAIGACSREDVFDDPVYPAPPENTPPNIDSFFPDTSVIDADVGDTIHFSITATDFDGDPLQFEYSLGPSVVAKHPNWMYVVGAAGTVEIQATASDGGRADSVTWQLNRHEVPDIIPPGPVTVEAVGVLNYSKHSVNLIVSWWDLGHEDNGGEASQYVVRYSEFPFINEATWLAASDVGGEPSPGVPGILRNMLINTPMFSDRLWVAVRAVDAAGNMSGIGTPGLVQWKYVSGVIRDAVSGDPIEGATISMAGATDVTSADGEYLILMLEVGRRYISIRDEGATGPVGNYFDIEGNMEISAGKNDFWMLPNITMNSNQYTDFLDFFWLLTVERNSGLYGWRHLPWEIPFDVYIPPRTVGTIDFQQRMKDAYTVWETVSGKDLVTFVSSEPAVGVFVEWVTDDRSIYFVEDRDDDHFPVKGKIQMEYDFTAPNLKFFDRIATHEAGHSLIIDHSTDGRHLMVGFRAIGVDAPDADEVALIEAIYNIPRGFDTRHFERD